jgi:cold shock CspA family protein
MLANMAGRSKVEQGIIIWFDNNAACGFIKPDSGGSDLFARLARKADKISEQFGTGDRVNYEFVAFGAYGKTQAVILAKAGSDRSG